MAAKVKYVLYFRVSTQEQGRSGLGLDAHYDDLPMPEVLAAWQNLPKAKKKGENKAKLMEEFMLLTDDTPPPYSLELLKQHDAFRRGDVESLSIVSWNAQLMNKMDGPNDQEIDQAIQTKSGNIASVVEGLGAALLVFFSRFGRAQ